MEVCDTLFEFCETFINDELAPESETSSSDSNTDTSDIENAEIQHSLGKHFPSHCNEKKDIESDFY